MQVEMQPHHVAGLWDNIRETLANSEAAWEYISYYECPADRTVTFCKAESNEAGRPGIWTYMVYACTAGKETVMTPTDLDTYRSVFVLWALTAQT